jgi:hypothetical protein
MTRARWVGLLAVTAALAIAWRAHARKPAPAAAAPALAVANAYETAPWLCPSAIRQTTMHYRVRPFAEAAPGARSNSSGFRTPEFTIARPPDTFRIVVVGDSYTWGQGVALSETFSEVLRARLAPRLKVEVIALGVCGHRFVDNVAKIEIIADRLDPDLVVIQTCHNDLEAFPYAERYDAQLADGRLHRLLSLTPPGSMVAEAILLGRLSGEYTRIGERIAAPGSIDWALFIEAADRLAAWRARARVPVVILAFPAVGLEPLPLEQMMKRMYAELGGRGMAVLDLAPAFDARSRGVSLVVSRSDLHPNAFAHAIAADALLGFLDARGLVSPSRRPAAPGWPTEEPLRARAREHWDEHARNASLQLELMRALGALHPDDPWFVSQLASSERAFGDAEKSRRDYERLPDLLPSHAAPWCDLASLEDADPVMARVLAEKMLAVAPDNIDCQQRLATLDFKAGRTREGCARLDRLVQLVNNRGAFHNLGAQRNRWCR